MKKNTFSLVLGHSKNVLIVTFLSLILLFACDPQLPDKPNIIVPGNDLYITHVEQSESCLFEHGQCDITLKGKASGEFADSTYKIYAYYNLLTETTKRWQLAEPKKGIRASTRWQIDAYLSSSILLWNGVKIEVRVVASDTTVPQSFPADQCPSICSDPVTLTISKAILPPIYIPDAGSLSSLAVIPFKCYLYATDPSGKQVVVVRTCPSDSVETSISLPNFPEGIAASPDGQSVYVCLKQENAISIIDVDSKKESKLRLAGSPVNIDVTPDGEYTYVVCQAQRLVYTVTMSKIREEQYLRKDSVYVGSKPFDVATGRFTKTAYITDETSSKIYLVRPKASLDSIDIVISPAKRIAVSPDERFAVVTLFATGQTTSQPKVVFINLASQPIEKRTVDIGGEPESLAITPNARTVWVTDRVSGQVVIIDAPSALSSSYAKYRKIKLSKGDSQAGDIAIDALMNQAYVINNPVADVWQLAVLRLDLIRP